MKKAWNQDKTDKFNPFIVDRWQIKSPGDAFFVKGKSTTLTQWQIIGHTGGRSQGAVYFGLYPTHEEAVKEVERLNSIVEKPEEPEEWIWDVDKKHKKRKAWLGLIVSWYLMPANNETHQAVAQDGTGNEMGLFSGTEQECQDYIDKHTK